MLDDPESPSIQDFLRGVAFVLFLDLELPFTLIEVIDVSEADLQLGVQNQDIFFLSTQLEEAEIELSVFVLILMLGETAEGGEVGERKKTLVL